MQFDQEYFDMGLNRMGTRCEKWDEMRREFGQDVIPLWVADMDFPSPPAVQEALLRRAAHPTYGYTAVLEDDWDAPIAFWQRRHGLALAQEEMMLLPCVVTGLKLAIRAVTAPGDGVVILSPVYGPFAMSVQATGRTLVDCPLTRQPDGRYDLNLAALEDALRAGAKAMLLCNPHNPVSRLWRPEELRAVAELTRRYHACLISDEIHADFVYAPGRFTPMLSIIQENVVSLCAASKTFNLAGLQQSLCLCKDKALMEKIRREYAACGIQCGNIFGLEATRAAYNEGDAWLDGLLGYLDGNRALLKEQVAELLPRAVLTPIEATYLAWLDMSAYGLGTEELMRRTTEAGVRFTDGDFFGTGGAAHLRVNFATPRRNLAEGIRRVAKAVADR